MERIKRIDIAEFREFGYLHEVNRRFFHPLGLALEVVVEDECFDCEGSGKALMLHTDEEVDCPDCQGSGKRKPEDVVERLGGVWDSRDDPEGFIYGDDQLDPEKADRIRRELESRRDPRVRAFGWFIQSVGRGSEL